MSDKTGMDDSRADRVYLGKVEEIHSTSNGTRLATLTPLIRSDWSGTEWEGPVQEPLKEFPDRGFVFWWDVPNGVSAGSYWQFQAEPHPTYAPPEKPEKYQAISPVSPVEVVDVRHGWPEAKVRRQFTVDGVFLRGGPIVEKVMIWFEKDQWIGPVMLERGSGPHLWTIAQREDLSRLEFFQVSTSLLRSLRVEGRRLFLPPTLELGKRIGFRNWMPDEKLASSLLSRIRRLDQQAYEALGTTYRVFETYQTVLENAGLEGHDLEQELARGKRVAELRSTIAENKDLLEEAASILLGTPEVVREVESLKAHILADVRREQEEKLELELQERQAAVEDRKKELSKILGEVAEATGRDQQLKDEIVTKEDRLVALSDELERAESAFKTELVKRLKKLSESPEEVFAEVAVLRALLGGPVSAPAVQEPAPLPPAFAAERERADSIQVHVVTDSRDAMRSVRNAFRSDGLPPALGAHLHSAFLSGAAPIVAGTRAYEAVAGYASATAGGRLVWIPVSSSAFEPQDLLGRFDPSTRTIVPHPAGLLDVLLEAHASEKTFVVVLDGFNRAPVDAYLLPVLQSYSDTWTNSRPRSLPISPPGQVQRTSAYADVTRVAWAPNVLLALIPTIGSGSFPIPEVLWDYAVLIDADGPGYGSSSTAPLEDNAEQKSCSEVSPDLWKQWRKSVRGAETGSVTEASKTLRDEDSYSVGAVKVAERVLAAARIFLSDALAMEFVIKTSLLPRAHELKSDRLVTLERFGVKREEAEAILAVAAKLAG